MILIFSWLEFGTKRQVTVMKRSCPIGIILQVKQVDLSRLASLVFSLVTSLLENCPLTVSLNGDEYMQAKIKQRSTCGKSKFVGCICVLLGKKHFQLKWLERFAIELRNVDYINPDWLQLKQLIPIKDDLTVQKLNFQLNSPRLSTQNKILEFTSLS